MTHSCVSVRVDFWPPMKQGHRRPVHDLWHERGGRIEESRNQIKLNHAVHFKISSYNCIFIPLTLISRAIIFYLTNFDLKTHIFDKFMLKFPNFQIKNLKISAWKTLNPKYWQNFGFFFLKKKKKLGIGL